MSQDKKVTLELSVYEAAAVRQSLFTDTKGYTYNLECCPQRVVSIRQAIVSIDKQIEEILNDNESS
jgi:hypothetical protein